LWRLYINTVVNFLDVVLHLNFYLKRRFRTQINSPLCWAQLIELVSWALRDENATWKRQRLSQIWKCCTLPHLPNQFLQQPA
jgi:hypothetical protein